MNRHKWATVFYALVWSATLVASYSFGYQAGLTGKWKPSVTRVEQAPAKVVVWEVVEGRGGRPFTVGYTAATEEEA